MMKQCGCSKNISCGCCEGVEALTPQPTANRPGLSALNYRIGTHSTFFETMEARLSGFYFETGDAGSDKDYPLAALKTRLENDTSIALLSAAATVFDVLTFYQERIANEGFLRTATERRSVLELGRLVGYVPRPGVAASVFLAYTMDDKSEPVEIPLGARAQSVPLPKKPTDPTTEAASATGEPQPEELPQSFETSEKLEARKEWNHLQPRMSKPRKITFDDVQGFESDSVLRIETIYFAGTDTKLKTNDPLLFVFEEVGGVTGERFTLRRAQTVTPDFDNNRTQVTLRALPPTSFTILPLMNQITLLLKGVPPFLHVVRTLESAETIRQNIRLGSYPRSIMLKDRTIRRSKDLETLLDALGGVINDDSIDEQIRDRLADIRSTFDTLLDNPVVPDVIITPPTNLKNLFKSLLAAPSRQPANSLQLRQSVKKAFSLNSDIRGQLLVNFQPGLADTLYPALSTAPVSVAQPELKAVYALRVTAPVFGYNAPKVFSTSIPQPPPIGVAAIDAAASSDEDEPTIANELENQIFLDNAYDKITASDENKTSYAVINHSLNARTRAFQIVEAKIRPRTEYRVSTQTTALTLDKNWWNLVRNSTDPDPVDDFHTIRQTAVYTQNEPLVLAEMPVNDEIGGGEIELAELYEGLKAGRWIIVSGERTDLQNVGGIKVSELAMISGIEQIHDEELPGDKIHSKLFLASSLAYKYRRKTVKIYGNVVKATHGETRKEVLGSGDATQAMQTFALKQPPLTFVSAPTPSGIESTLKVYVNDVRWHETGSLAGLKPQDRKFFTKIDDESKTSVIFGNGEQGARLPTGVENVKAVYRNGIGKAGNVKAEQISTPVTKPLGVKEVINPLRASGGADKETRDQARRNVPIALMALDRLVSTRDYADFARTFAGIGKASAARLSDDYRQIVHLTIAGAEDIPIDVNSDLYNNLRRALSKYGNPFLPVQIDIRELLALVIVARVSIHADYLWESVAPKIRTALLGAFSFERRELGQSVFLGEVISVIQSVEGVIYSDIDVLDSISEAELGDENAMKSKTDSWSQTGNPKPYVRAELARKPKNNFGTNLTSKRILPAQLAYLTPDVPDTLILNQIEEVKK